jgi:hypothetical protein
VAYLAGTPGRGGRILRVVDGDGTGDHAVAAAGAAAPAWHPGTVRHVLAYADVAGRVVVRDVDAGRLLWRARPSETPRALTWSHDGHRLLAVSRREVTAYAGGSGRRLGRSAAPPGTEDVLARFAPYGRRYVLVRRVAATGDHRLLLVARGRERLLHVGAGALRAVAWAPDGAHLALDVAGAPGWTLLALRAGGPGAQQTLAAGAGGRLAGWCCSPTS